MLDIVYELVKLTVSMIIGGFIVSKIIKKDIKNDALDVYEGFKAQIKYDAEQWLNGETGQKALFQIGALIGNGAKSGIGLQKRGGKKGLEGFIMDIAGEFLKNKFGQSQQPQQPQQPTQNLNRQGTL